MLDCLVGHVITSEHVKFNGQGKEAGKSVKSRSSRQVERGNLAVIRFVHDRIIHKILSEDHVNLCTINIQSIKNKEAILLEYLTNNKINIALVTETWLSTSDTIWMSGNCLTQSGFSLDAINRVNRQGGGIALITTSNIKPTSLPLKETKCFEYGAWKIKYKSHDMVLLGIYHPPPSQKNLQTNIEFIDELVALYVELSTDNSNIMLTGDFNIHMSNEKDTDAISLREALRMLGLEQSVTFPTHRKGNILDLVITEVEGSVRPVLTSRGDYLSDHAAVNVVLKWRKGEVAIKTKRVQDWSAVDATELIQRLDLGGIESDDINEVISQYQERAKQITAELVPVEDKNITIRKEFPWYTLEIREQRKILRRREKIWRKYREDHHWLALKRERNRYNNMLKYTRNNIINTRIRECS